MTPEELRIACAEKCGWEYTIDNTGLTVYNPRGTIVRNVGFFFLNQRNDQQHEKFAISNYPDYEHDRNALFELIKTIPKYRHSDFIKALTDILDFDLQLFTDGETLAGNITDVIWDLLIADPIAIMRAFLIVMEDNQ
jgi:hypothetical protein